MSTDKTMITIHVNKIELQVEAGENLLKVLQSTGVRIPALCFHPAVKKPSGLCRMCTVEIAYPEKRSEAKHACLVKTVPGLAVQSAPPRSSI